MQTRLRGQFTGKWAISLVCVSRPLVTVIIAITYRLWLVLVFTILSWASFEDTSYPNWLIEFGRFQGLLCGFCFSCPVIRYPSSYPFFRKTDIHRQVLHIPHPDPPSILHQGTKEHYKASQQWPNKSKWATVIKEEKRNHLTKAIH